MAEQDQQQSVQAESLAAAEGEAQTAAGAVNASAETSETDAQGVPWRNRMAEMERRHEKHLADMQAMFAQQMQAMQPQAAPAPQRPAQQQYSDEELLALGNQGHAVAMQEYIARQVQKQTSVQRQASDADLEIQALRTAYPEFNNKASALYQAANMRYQQLLANGNPATPETQARAFGAVAAIAARQAQQQNQQQHASEGARQGQIDAHQSVAGTSVAPAGANRPRPRAPTQDQIELARKIGAKDPAKALANFRKRNEEGRSSFGAGLSAAAERMLP